MKARFTRSVLLALALASPASADYKDDFKKGMEAIAAKDWPRVELLMRAAIKQKSKEGEAVRVYGVRYETYLPHYYLGVARLNQGDCPSAITAWAESEKQGAIQKTTWFAMLQQDVEGCRSRLARASETPPPPRVAQAVPLPSIPNPAPPTPTPAVTEPPERSIAQAAATPVNAPGSPSPRIPQIAASSPTPTPVNAMDPKALRPGLVSFFGGQFREARIFFSGVAVKGASGQSQPLLLLVAASAAAELREDPSSTDAKEVFERVAPLVEPSTLSQAQRMNSISPGVLQRIAAAGGRSPRM